jgi:hypothetical protein
MIAKSATMDVGGRWWTLVDVGGHECSYFINSCPKKVSNVTTLDGATAGDIAL